MKDYDNSYNRPGTNYVRYLKYQRIITQGRSPVVNGNVILKPNGLFYNRHEAFFPDITIYKDGVISSEMTAQFTWRNAEDFMLTSSEYDYVEQLAINKCLQKVSGIRVNALELYATRVQTVNTVAKRVGQLANAMLALKRGRWKQFKRHLGLNKNLKKPGARKFEDIPGLWLEYSFGWVPLISDVYTILNKTFEPPSTKVEAVIRESADHEINKYENLKRYVGNNHINIRAHASCQVSVDVPALAALSQYGINNPLAVAWELVPYSFVVDWFIPVGDYIEQLGATAGLLLSEQQVTVTQDAICNYQMDISDWLAFSRQTSSDAVTSVNQHYKRKQRRLPKSFDFKMIVDDPLNQSSRRLSYALSLLSLAFSRKK